MSASGSQGRIASIRAGGATHHALQVGGAVIGIAVATVHWSGFLLGGVLVGVLATSVRRAVLAGIGVGVFGWVTFAVLLAVQGGLGTYLDAGRPMLLSLVIPPLLGGVGGLARGVV